MLWLCLIWSDVAVAELGHLRVKDLLSYEPSIQQSIVALTGFLARAGFGVFIIRLIIGSSSLCVFICWALDAAQGMCTPKTRTF